MDFYILPVWQKDPFLRNLCEQLVTWVKSNISSVLIPFIVKDEYVSKRLIYWTVSKYAQSKTIQIVQPSGVSNIYAEYSNYLRTYNRRLFDVFCREPYVLDLEIVLEFDSWKRIHNLPFTDTCQQRIYELLNRRAIVRTTIGQLNFFFWASKHGILAYVRKYEAVLMKEMKADSRKRRLDAQSHPSKKQRPNNESIVILHRPCTVPI